MNRISRIAGAAALAAMASSAWGQITGSANLSTQALGGQFRYSAVLHNTGTTDIGTLWFAWIPGYDFMPGSPTNIVSPPGWAAVVFHTGVGDGYSIQWVASPGAALAHGNSLPGFGFDSPNSPAILRGPAPTFPVYLVTQSYIYIGGPELDPGSRFVASVANPCYPNCDGSTTTPVLNVNDFICFQSRFAAGDTYANCDGSTTPPVLNVNDFVCFQSAFAAGCP